MNESDTFLDEILDGVTTTPRVTPEGEAPATKAPPVDAAPTRPAKPLTDLDQLLDGLSPSEEASGSEPGRLPAASNGTGTAIADDRAEAIDAAASPEETSVSQDSAPALHLPVAAPHEILGLPEQPDVSASHFEIANEVKGVTETEAVAGSGNSHSFAAIAREIAATVDDSDRKSKEQVSTAEAGQEADRASFYVRSSRRRRRHSTHRVALTQVIGLVLLLVLGLAGEWEYVSRGQSNQSTKGALTVPSSPTVRLPRIAATNVAGARFQVASSGSAQSSLFKVTKPFSVAWSIRCSQLPKVSSVQILFQTSGHTALNILIGVTSHSVRSGPSKALGPGTYYVVAHAPGACAWKAQGIPRA